MTGIPPRAIAAAAEAIHRADCEWDLAECVEDHVHDRAATEALEAAAPHLTETVFAPVSGTSRKIGREWCRVRPGVQARLLSFGGVNDEAFAWIDIRPEANGGGDCNCTCPIAGTHDPDCAVYGPPQEPPDALPPRTCTCEHPLSAAHDEYCPALDDR